jgi:gliding motility-associated-like protein
LWTTVTAKNGIAGATTKCLPVATTNCINVTAAGTYTVTVTNSSGCISVCSKAVTVSPAPDCTITGNSSISVGGSTQLCTPLIEGSTYLWSTITAKNGIAGAITKCLPVATTNCINVTAAGTYTVTVTNSSGCISVCSKTVTVSPTPDCPTITDTTPGSICGSGTVSLKATASAGTINWYAASLGGSSLGTGPSFTTPSLSATTTYYVDATSGTCTTSTRTAVVATVNPAPAASVTITASPSGPVCDGTLVVLTATPVNGGAPTYQWRVDGEPVPGETVNSISSTTFRNGAIKTVVMTSSLECVTGSPALSNAITLAINPLPTVTSTTPGSVCGSGTANLEAEASSGTINWYSSASVGSPIGTGNNFTTPPITVTTTYYVEAESSGCTSTNRTPVVASITSTHKDIMYLFTPNNDGINDKWELPEIRTYGKCDVKVFNRWGKEVYANQDYDNTWEGISSGSPLPEGAYYFVIKTEKAGVITGTVNIVR